MSRLNRPTQPVRTHEGGIACRTSSYQELRRTVLSCLLWEKTFYESGESVAERIVRLVPQCKPYEVAELAVEARERFKLRHVPLLLVRELARVRNLGSMVSETLSTIIQRPDELCEFLALYWAEDAKAPIASQVKKGLAFAFRKFSGYQLAKYNRDNAIKLRDVLFLVHAKPRDDAQAAVWKQLVEGNLPIPDTWEVALSTGANKRETFTRLLSERKLGYMALLRNLRNMWESGVDHELVRGALMSGAKGSKALPFRFISAARSVKPWEPIIEQAMLAAMEDQQKLPGRTVLFVDVSGSMNAKLSDKSDLTRSDAAQALGILVRGICEEARVFVFDNDYEEVPPRSGMALADQLKWRNKGTELGKCLCQLHAHGVTYDRIIVITDEQTRDNVPDPLGRGYIINVAPYQNGVGYGAWTKIDGFSEAVVQFIQESESLIDRPVS